MISPKEKLFISKYIDTFNPITPSEKLMKYLATIKVPKAGYITNSMRGKQLLDLEDDAIDYLAHRCKQCTGDMKLMAKVLYYIKWYEELLEDGDGEDLEKYEELFREDFSGYAIDFGMIFNESKEDIKGIAETNNEVALVDESNVEVDFVKPKVTEKSSRPSVEFKRLSGIDKCTNTNCTSPKKFGGLPVNAEGFCENCYNNMDK